ncbi:unnamed protein product, partial [Notodromas monacha]
MDPLRYVLLLGAALFALAAWIRYQDDFKEWIIELGLQHFWNGIYVLFTVGVLSMILSFVGCIGAINESPGLLRTFMVLNGVMFILTLAGAAYTLDHGIEYSKLSPWLKNRLLQLVDGYEHNTRDRRIMDMIQEFVSFIIPYSIEYHIEANLLNIFQLLGAALFALAAWIRYQDDFKEWIIELGLQHFWNGIYILFTVGVLSMILSFVGCIGAINESPGLLRTFMVLNGVMFILTLAGAAYTLDHGIEYSKLSPWLKNRLLQLVDGYEHNTRDRRIMDMIQEF